MGANEFVHNQKVHPRAYSLQPQAEGTHEGVAFARGAGERGGRKLPMHSFAADPSPGARPQRCEGNLILQDGLVGPSGRSEWRFFIAGRRQGRGGGQHREAEFFSGRHETRVGNAACFTVGARRRQKRCEITASRLPASKTGKCTLMKVRAGCFLAFGGG